MAARRVVLDTETTGLEPSLGHRVIEIACVELFGRRPTGNQTFTATSTPTAEIDIGAIQVHGLTNDFLADKPRFADVAEEFLEFVEGAELLIHNAAFDVGLLDAELALAGKPGIRASCRVTDTLVLARQMHPGKRNSLDALCERYGVSNAHRKLHGALLDAELLADVYLAMTRGQDSLEMALQSPGAQGAEGDGDDAWPPAGLAVVRADDTERAAHRALLEAIQKDAKGPSLWVRLESAAPPG